MKCKEYNFKWINSYLLDWFDRLLNNILTTGPGNPCNPATPCFPVLPCKNISLDRCYTGITCLLIGQIQGHKYKSLEVAKHIAYTRVYVI